MDQSPNEPCLEVVQLVVRRNLHSKAKDVTNANLVNELTNLTHCRLDRESLISVPLLSFLPCLTNLYLQCNSINRVPDLSYLSELRFLSLAENLISKVEGIKSLKKLGLLDLSENHIRHFDCTELPKSLMILNMNGNPCVDSRGFRDDIVAYLPNLKSLDGEPVSNDSSSESEEEDEDSDSQHEEKSAKEERAENSMQLEDAPGDDFYDGLKAKMVESFSKFSFAVTENEKHLQKDFAGFTSIVQSPVFAKDDQIKCGLSEQEVSDLEKEAADITNLQRLNSAKKINPRPPPGAKRANHTRTRPPSGGATATRVRIPGARPFKRIAK